MQHFCSFGSDPSQDPARPAWWGDRLAYFSNAASATAAAYELYSETFRLIRENSVIRAHLEHDEFVQVVQSPSTYNIGIFEDERLVGLCSLDTNVATNAALNPIALQRMYPDQYSRAAVYYCWFMATRHDSRGQTKLLAQILEGIGELVTERRGCVIFDVVGIGGNLEPDKRARALKALGTRFATTTVDTLDTEHYFAIHISPKLEPVIDLRGTEVEAQTPTSDASDVLA